MAGIPRVIQSLAVEAKGLGYVPVVWDRGLLGRVEISTQGHVIFPTSVWRRNPRRLTLRVLAAALYAKLFDFFLQRTGAVASTAMVLLVLGAQVGHRLKPIIDWANPLTRFSRVRQPIKLMNCHVLIPAIPDPPVGRSYLKAKEETPSFKFSVLIHDLLPLSHPEFFFDDEILRHGILLKLAGMASSLVVGTPILEKQVRAVMMSLFGAAPRIVVAPLPVSLVSAGKANGPVSGKLRLLFIGGFEERKALRQFAHLIPMRLSNIEIRIVGAPHVLRKSELVLARELASRGEFKLLGRLDDNQLLAELEKCDCVVYCSGAEGYGLPILEALAIGRPVLAADTEVNRLFSELYGGIHLIGASDQPPLDRTYYEELSRSIEGDRIPLDVNSWATSVMQRPPNKRGG